MTWHVATTKSGKEAAAVHDMLAIGLDAYFPQKTRWKQLQLRKVPVKSPIIPGYVFFRLNDPEEAQYISTCDGVTGVLTCGFTPEGDRKLAALPPEEDGGEWVERIRAEEERGDYDSTIDRRPQVKPGDLVRIVVGSFADHLATIRRAANKREWDVVIQGAGKMQGHKVTVAKDGVEMAA